MCKIVFVKGTDRSYDCADRGELESAIGGSAIYRPGPVLSKYACLCGLDAEKTAKAFGLELLEDTDGSIVHFVLPTKG
jgi:hypothetical protein